MKPIHFLLTQRSKPLPDRPSLSNISANSPEIITTTSDQCESACCCQLLFLLNSSTKLITGTAVHVLPPTLSIVHQGPPKAADYFVTEMALCYSDPI